MRGAVKLSELLNRFGVNNNANFYNMNSGAEVVGLIANVAWETLVRPRMGERTISAGRLRCHIDCSLGLAGEVCVDVILLPKEEIARKKPLHRTLAQLLRRVRHDPLSRLVTRTNCHFGAPGELVAAGCRSP